MNPLTDITTDPRAGKVFTATDAAGRPLHCLDCGCFVDALFEDLPAFAGGHAFPRCSDCRGDRRVLAIVAPAPAVVARRRADREAAAERRWADSQMRARRAA